MTRFASEDVDSPRRCDKESEDGKVEPVGEVGVEVGEAGKSKCGEAPRRPMIEGSRWCN
jgi:hypothetical protein